MGKEHRFRKDFTPEQYAVYLERKAKNPEAFVPEKKEMENILLSKKKGNKPKLS